MSTEFKTPTPGTHLADDVSVLSIPASSPWRRLDKVVIFVVAFAASGLARYLAYRFLHDVPHVMDEIAYLFQARTFATGHLHAPVELPRAAFNLWFVEDGATRYSIFPPGWPAVLAGALKLGVGAWINPALHGATVVVVAYAANKLSGPRAAKAVAIGYGFCPQSLILAASLMSHTLIAFASAIVLATSVGASDDRRTRVEGRALIAGAAVGVAICTRPLCGAVLAMVAAVGFALTTPRAVRLRAFVFMLGPAAVFVGLLLGYNRTLTGDAFVFPQTAYFDRHLAPVDNPYFRFAPGCNALGFGPTHGCVAAGYHDLKHGLLNTRENLRSWLLLAGGPVVFVLAAYALVARSRRFVALLLGTVVVTVSAYALYWYVGTSYGARFFHLALPALLLASALGYAELVARSRKKLTLFTSIAWGLACLGGGLAAIHELSASYWGLDDRFAKLERAWHHGPALVMVAFASEGQPMSPMPVTGGRTTETSPRWLNSARSLGALARNAPLGDSEVLFAKYHPGLVSELQEGHPNRTLYLYVVHDDPESDSLEQYTPEVGEPIAAPSPNFDGFLIEQKTASWKAKVSSVRPLHE